MMPADHALQSKQNNLKNEKKNHGKSVCDECCQKKKRKENSSISNISRKFLGN